MDFVLEEMDNDEVKALIVKFVANHADLFEKIVSLISKTDDGFSKEDYVHIFEFAQMSRRLSDIWDNHSYR